MKIGVVSDIHGNLEALNAAVDFLEDRVDFLISLGDVVGYGPDPENCIDIISAKTSLMLRGNHEEALLKQDFSRLKEDARVSLEWTAEHLKKSYIEQFAQYPMEAVKEEIFFAHASVSNPLHKYIFTKKNAEEEFPLLKKRICFIGHTHIPGGFEQDMNSGKVETIYPDFSGCLNIELKDSSRYIINAGSVGQPRDGFPFACILIYGTDEKIVSLHRIEYPAETTRKKIIEAGLPSVLAKRVMQGI